MANLLRKGHFLGAKLRSIRKRNGLTLEELSTRCIQTNAQMAPSVSYLSMIESGKRMPSEDVLGLLAGVFQREVSWFLDEQVDVGGTGATPKAGGATRVPLEPAFLFSKELLQAAIPELLSQTGTSGRQFAHLLIRSHQEMSRNDFPDLERTAESIGERTLPLTVPDLMALAKHHGLQLRWFERRAVLVRDNDQEVRSTVRSFFEAPHTVYLNQSLRADPARLKFDLATHIGHKVLHGGDGMKSPHATGGEMGGSPESGTETAGLARLRVQLLRRRVAVSEDSVSALSGPQSVPHRARHQAARAHPRGGDASHDQGVAVSVLALLRCLSSRLPARGLPR
jgi:transcriptional regulator with XRE-family HTH domain